MSCCGKRREELHDLYLNENSDLLIAEFFKTDVSSEVGFEYTGDRTMTVTGSVSRRQYFFSKKGDIQFVNYTDAAGMLGVPNVRKVKS